MDVRGLGSVGASVPINRTPPPAQTEKAASVGPATPQDQVEISDVGRMLEGASRTPGLREQRLAQIKAAIADGTYDSPEKLELALGRLIDTVVRDESQPGKVVAGK